MTEQRDMLANATPDELRTMLEEDEALPENQRRWPQDLAAILRLSEGVLRRDGVDEDRAFTLASRIALEIARYGGGRMLYLPQGWRIRTALRDAEIWRRFTGRNHHELAQEFKVTVPTMYEILREQRQLDVSRRQGGLFNEGTS